MGAADGCDVVVAGGAKWYRLALNGLSVCLGFFGLVNLASITATHGLEWHGILREVVNGYRNTVYPIYDVVLRPLARYLNVSISLTERDVLTVILLSLAAANAESLARDGRPVVITIFRMMKEMSAFLSEDNRRKEFHFAQKNFLTQSLPIISFLVYVPFLLIVVFGTTGAMWSLPFTQQSWPAIFYHEVLPHWAYWCVRHWYIGLAIALAAIHGMNKLETGSPAMIMLLFTGLIGLLPILVLVVVPFGAAFAVAALTLAILAPLIAWRTVSATLLAFGLLLVANWAVASGTI